MEFGNPFIIKSKYNDCLPDIRKYFFNKISELLDKKDKDSKKLIYDIFLINKVLFFSFENILKEQNKTDLVAEIKKIKVEKFESDYYKFLDKILDIISAKNINQAIKIDKIKEIIEIIKDTSENERDIERSNVSLRIEIKNKTEKLNRIIENIGSLNIEKEIFDFKWSREISSGEKALIILFSRVYDTINKLDKDKSYVILLDEPDIYMHPEWQRNLLQELINFLKYYLNEYNVQIILTSHSPFVISDLPRENVIFLDKDDDGKCKVVESSEKKKTFGANIHTLLSNGFFMESTLGEFARSKISWIMEILDKDIEDIRKEEGKIRIIINMIGEPIIKNKLMKMLEDKLKLNMIGVDERIRRLEEEIKELKKAKGE